jgi:hypothetical protein
MEIVTETHADPWEYPTYPYLQDFANVSGVLSSTLTWGKDWDGTWSGLTIPPGGSAEVGWTTADNGSQLTDIRWVTSGGSDLQTINPVEEEGIAGGGYVVYNPVDGSYQWVITNKTPIDQIILQYTQQGVYPTVLTMEELLALLDTGVLGSYVEQINAAIEEVKGMVEQAALDGLIPSPSANSILRKLDRAIANNLAAFEFYQAGNLTKALASWAKAVSDLENVISEITNASAKGNVPDDLAQEWIDLLNEIIADLQGLPWSTVSPLEGQNITWNSPGQLNLGPIADGSTIVLMGKTEGPDGILEWLEAFTTPLEPEDEVAPAITSASITPDELWPPNHDMIEMTLDVDITDNGQANPPWAVWYVASVTSNQDENGTGDGDVSPDWLLDPQDPQSLSLRRERSGNDPTEVRLYTVTLLAVDAGGNVSAPYELVVPVDHDSGNTSESGTVTSLAVASTRGRGAQITFTLAGTGAVQAQVLNIAGRPVATVIADRQYEAGTHSLVWNGHSSRGLAVPAGTYLIRVTAHAEDGAQSSRVCAVRVGN